MGTEVKSLRLGRASLADAFATIDDGEVYLHNVHIPEYAFGSWTNHTPRRVRKLLLHKAEILRLIGKTKESGLTLVPLSLYFSEGKVKVETGPGQGQEDLGQAPGSGQAGRRPGGQPGARPARQGHDRLSMSEHPHVASAGERVSASADESR